MMGVGAMYSLGGHRGAASPLLLGLSPHGVLDPPRGKPPASDREDGGQGAQLCAAE